MFSVNFHFNELLLFTFNNNKTGSTSDMGLLFTTPSFADKYCLNHTPSKDNLRFIYGSLTYILFNYI